MIRIIASKHKTWSGNCLVLYSDDNPEDLTTILEEHKDSCISKTMGDTCLVYVMFVRASKNAELTRDEWSTILHRCEQQIINQDNLKANLEKHIKNEG